MPKPHVNVEEIELPSIDTPMADFAELACGRTYHVSFTVRRPYRGVSDWDAQLPARAPTEWHVKRAHEMRPDDLGDMLNRAALADLAVEAARDVVSGRDPRLPARIVVSANEPPPSSSSVRTFVDPANAQAIRHLIGQAERYGGQAKKIWDYWSLEWRPEVLRIIDGDDSEIARTHAQAVLGHWPLDKTFTETFPLCSAKSGESEVVIDLQNVRVRVAVQCPPDIVKAQHDGDVEAFSALILASMIWARCAEEAAAVIGLSHLNRELFDQRSKQATAN